MDLIKAASAATVKTISGGQFTQASAGGTVNRGFFLDMPPVLPQKFWIVLAATMWASMNNPFLGSGPFNGIFSCPQGTPIPFGYGSPSTLPFRAPESDNYQFDKNQYQPGPTYAPLQNTDDVNSLGVPVWYFNKPFIVLPNGFVRGMLSSGGGSNPNFVAVGSVVTLNFSLLYAEFPVGTC